MRLLRRIQARTFPKWQLIGFAVTLLIGLLIIGVAAQVYVDMAPILGGEQALVGQKGIVVSKRISAFKTLDKSKIYFSDEELEELRQQDFVEDLGYFEKARFEISAFTKEDDNVPGFRTHMFFEAIPDRYMDVEMEAWDWTPESEILPIVIPQDYISLYNFGFAESQGLPVISRNAISEVEFGIRIKGNGEREELRSQIAGFSETVNSILVPKSFLDYANARYGSGGSPQPSRLLIALNDPTDEAALAYFDAEGLEVGQSDVEQSRLWFFFKILFGFLLLIAGVIILLSVNSILMSMNLLLYKNKRTINNLYLIGYENAQIGRFYILLVSSVIIITSLIAMVLCWSVHQVFLEKMDVLYDVETWPAYALVLGIVALSLCGIYVLLLRRRLKGLNAGIVG